MKLHPREFPVQLAHNDIATVVTEAIGRHKGLTFLELLAILNQIAAAWIKVAILEERKPTDAIQPGEKQ